MKIKSFLSLALMAALVLLPSCEEKEEQLGAASISIAPAEVSLGSEAGASATVELTATRQWTVNNTPSWLTVTPNGGDGSNKAQTITLTAKSNPDIDRDANVTFTIGFSDAVLKVRQAGEAGTVADALLYKNNFDKDDAKNNSGWPYLDQTDCWNNEEGNGKDGVKYEYSGMSVRQSGKLSNDTGGFSLYAGSGRNKLFFGKTSSFAVKGIALGGKTSLALSFGGQRYGADDKDNTYNPEEFKVYVSVDGVKGVEVPVTFASGSAPIGNWDLATAKFAVPAGTESLIVVFKCANLKTEGTGGVYSIDDLQLSVATGGSAIDFTNAVSLGLDQSGNIPDSDEVTDLATIITKPAGSNVTILNATITAVTTRGYVIGKGDNAIYVYKNADPKLAVGDKVSLIGTFKYYWGEYEIVDASEKKTGTATPEYPTPVEINKDFLTRTAASAATDEESTNYSGIWYPKYAHASAVVHKDGNYTQFKVEGYEGYISLSSAPSSMFADATGTSWGEGNEVELLGYYTGWESKNSYHQFIAVSVTGKATYTPVAPAVAGDDVFIAANVAHDQSVTNGSVINNPVTVGDASFSFDGGGNNGKYYDAGSAVRMYKEGSLKIVSGKPIVKIEYLFAPKDNNGTYNPVADDLEKLFKVGTCTFDEAKNILTWTGNATEVTLTYPLESGNYRFQQVGVTYGEDVEKRLAVSPATISVKAEETSAKFTVQSNVAWKIASDSESFVADPASGEGTKEVVVTFPANTSLEKEVTAKLTVSADGVDNAVVTITQAKAIDQNAVTDIKSACWDVASGTSVELFNVVVSAVTYRNYIVTDGTSAIYVYANSASHGRKVGEKLNLTGKTSWYNGLLELTGSKVEKVVSEGNEVPYPTPVELTGSILNNNYEKTENNSPFYAKFTAVTKIDGNYVQFTPEGANHYISLTDLPNAVKETMNAGETVIVYGYYGSWHSKNLFHQFYYVKHEVVGAAVPSLKVAKNAIDVAASATSAAIDITANVAWTASVASGTATLIGANGTTGASVSGSGNGKVSVEFAANEDTENAKTYTVTISGEGVDPVTVTITQAKAVSQSGGGESKTVSVTMLSMAQKYSATTNGTQVGTLELAEGVFMSVNTDGNNGKFYANGEEWRIYQSNNPTVTIKVTSGELVSVKFQYTQSNGGTLVYDGSNVASAQEVKLSGSSASFTTASTTAGATNGQVRIKNVEIVYK